MELEHFKLTKENFQFFAGILDIRKFKMES